MALKRDIKYLGRDFNDFRNELIEYTKTYFPQTYNDFSPASPGMLFMEQAAYIGDVLSFYLDNQIQETFIQSATQRNNIYELAYMLGYKPKISTAATTTVNVYQTVPASSGQPDFSYALTIGSDTVLSSTTNTGINFLTQDIVDFNFSSSEDPTDISVFTFNGSDPETYLLKKTVKAISATVQSEDFTFGNYSAFPTVELTGNSILGILDITDSDGNKWYEVDHLAQDMVFDTVKNTNPNDPNNYQNSGEVPYLLQLKQTQRRFTTRVTANNTLQIQFGSGNNDDTDEDIVPNPNNVGLGLPFEKDKLTTAFSPTNFIFTNAYGIAPANLTLTIRYYTGGGVASNLDQNQINTISPANVSFNTANVGSSALAQETLDSLAATNPNKATGGTGGDSLEQIRQNTLSAYQNQLRTVTSDDYMIRALSMPSLYGTVAKAYAEPEKVEDLLPGELPSSTNLYILSYNNTGKLTDASSTLKTNLRTYLSQYRVLNDSVKIKDAYVINIGVDFEVVTYPNYNNNLVLRECILVLQDYFSIDKWQINEPIILKDLFIALDKVEGVQTVKNIIISNKTGVNYSNYSYDTKGATVNNVVYPSLDPMIFEVKFPNTDIKGRVVPL